MIELGVFYKELICAGVWTILLAVTIYVETKYRKKRLEEYRAHKESWECRAVQFSDSMVCERCDLTWDINDIHPPFCKNFEKYGD